MALGAISRSHNMIRLFSSAVTLAPVIPHRFCVVTCLLGLMLGAASRASSDELHVDVGGFELAAEVQGRGGPAVVFETGGGGGPMSHWQDLPDLVSVTTRVVIYDRAGIGASEPSPEPRTGPQVARELRALLQALQIPPPYIFVGHSLGGLFIRFYAELYPDDVAAFVFLDPTTEDMRPKLDTAESREAWAAQLESLPPGARAEMQALPTLVNTAAEFGPPPDRPAVVITGMKPPELSAEQRAAMEAAGISDEKLREGQQRAWRLHESLAGKFTSVRHVAATQSGHYVHWDQPELVVREIRAVLAEVQSHGGG